MQVVEKPGTGNPAAGRNGCDSIRNIPQGDMHVTSSENEIAHGEWLASGDTEEIWGWGTPAGRLRAQRCATLIAANADLCSRRKALELGCGTGLFTEMFAATGANILAVDISPSLLAKARQRKLPEHLEFVEGRFEDCDAVGPFDAIIGSSVLHHLDVEVALARMFLLLKPGGRISFAEPNYLNPQVFMERQLRLLPAFAYTSPDETAFVRWRLARQLRLIGFEQIRIEPFDWLHPATPACMIQAVLMIGEVLEKLPAVREFAGSLHITAQKPVTVA